jgi:membrane associated rhomboid family serine protease
VTNLLILVIVLGAAGLYVMKPDERMLLVAFFKTRLLKLRDLVTLGGVGCEEFFEALRTRTRRVIVTPILIGLGAIVTVYSWTSHSDHGGLRHLMIAMFVHPGLLDLVINAACLLQVGLILERLVGRLAFSTVYIGGGAAVGLMTFALTPDGIGAGATGSVIAAYGVLLVTSAWSAYQRTALMIPLPVAKRMAPLAGVFLLYHLISWDFSRLPILAALTVGIAAGVAISRNVGEVTPPYRPLIRTLATVIIIVMAYSAFAMHGPTVQTADVRPELERVIATEHRTADLYDKAVEKFRKGRINAKALAEVIQHTIVPELHTLTTRINALHDLPPEDRPLKEAAEEFLKQRDESWKMRAAALVKGDIMALRQADKKQQDSLDIFRRMTAQQLGGG